MREIEELQVERGQLKKDVDECLQAKADAALRLQDHRTKLEEGIQSIHRIGIELGGIKKDLERLEDRLNQNLREKETVEMRLNSLNAEIQQGNLSEGDIQVKIGEAEKAVASGQEQQKAAEEKVHSAQRQREVDQAGLAELRAEKIRLEQEETGKGELIKGLERQCQELRDECVGHQGEIARIVEEALLFQGELEETKAKLLLMEEEENRANDYLAENRSKRDKIRMDVATEEDKMRKFRQTQNVLQGQVHRIELQVNKNRMAHESIINHLVESYGADWTSFVQENWTTPAKPKEIIDTMRREIRALGPVNVGAVEEYERIKERNDFLKKQYDDLINAKGTLERVIAEIERTIRQRFLETFAQVRQAFIEIFTGLFTGGKADLLLMDPEDPLETGIEILAQPPGKRLQSLSLLSGGERAMTAIALLFAILRIKPSPFCILDEIDATLDDVNVTRFADLLSQFSQDLQFIVITHRRGTMEMSNALYGVTMEELGVSKLFSVDLQRKVG